MAAHRSIQQSGHNAYSAAPATPVTTHAFTCFAVLKGYTFATDKRKQNVMRYKEVYVGHTQKSVRESKDPVWELERLMGSSDVVWENYRYAARYGTTVNDRNADGWWQILSQINTQAEMLRGEINTRIKKQQEKQQQA